MPIGKTSKAWLYFSTKDDPKSQKAVCSLCEKEVACSGETTNLLSHLQKWHREIYDKFLPNSSHGIMDQHVTNVTIVAIFSSEPSVSLEEQHPLRWWKKHEHLYPNLAIMARKCLCVTATSVPSEQLFSTAGNIVNNKRGALLPEYVEKLLYLHNNLPKLNFEYERMSDDN